MPARVEDEVLTISKDSSEVSTVSTKSEKVKEASLKQTNSENNEKGIKKIPQAESSRRTQNVVAKPLNRDAGVTQITTKSHTVDRSQKTLKIMMQPNPQRILRRRKIMKVLQ